MKTQLVSGSVSLQQHNRDQGFSRNATSAIVHLDGIETFVLRFRWQISLLEKYGGYQLTKLDGQVIQSWAFDFSFAKTTLDLSIGPEFPLWYQKTLFGKNSFITASGKKPTYMDLTSHSRSYELDGMKFRHRDFQSEISFQCPEERLTQGILVANLLFTPPYSTESE